MFKTISLLISNYNYEAMTIIKEQFTPPIVFCRYVFTILKAENIQLKAPVQ